MNLHSTHIHHTDSEQTTSNFTVGYDSDSPMRAETLSIISLQWTPHQEVVTFPQRTFYITVGKRLVDVLISGFTIVFILSWLIPVVGVLILIDSKGPILFSQTRSGRKGKPFLCLKFRTMTHIPITHGPFSQTAYNDHRVTVLGRFLRKSNLDEMPQFINVFLGHMSLVGPRPHAVPHDAMHWDLPAYRERYWVRPGITGLAQIRGARGATSATQQMAHRVRYDLLYIAHQTFGLDMKICYRTLAMMLKGDRNAW